MTMAGEDPRDHAQFGAAWLAGYVAALSGSRIDCITLGGLTGPRGLLGPSGKRRPSFDIARQIAISAGTRRLVSKSSQANRVAAFGGLSSSGDASVLVANLTNLPQSVRLMEKETFSLKPFECRELSICTFDGT
jgi:hypothetical protein